MKKFRLFYDKDKATTWLEKMSNEGWAMKNFFLGIFTFEACKPGAYHYQVDLLDNWEGDKTDFGGFMEETGVEVVSQWYRWVYLRKKAQDGPFELYTDAESKIKQYTRIRNFFIVFTVIELICLFIELQCAVKAFSLMYGMFTILLVTLTFVFAKMAWKYNKRMKALKVR